MPIAYTDKHRSDDCLRHLRLQMFKTYCKDDQNLMLRILMPHFKDNITLIKMSEQLKLWLSYRGRKEAKTIEINHKEVRISVNQILKKVKDFLVQGNESVPTYLSIWIESKGIRENLFKLRKKGIELRLAQSENSKFQLNVIIEDGSEKNNIIKNFQLNYDSYERLKNNIERVIQYGNEEEKGKDQKCARPIDIAYFFADPLISKSYESISKYKVNVQNQVSYQVQYDQFINMVKGQDFRRNFRIEMMVATETNIRNTLIEGASVLHFSCHGNIQGALKIEHERYIGELATLTSDQFMNLLKTQTLPRVIIFNVCHSYELAKRVSTDKQIVTIGYKGEASDRYCQKFTKEFYMGLFRDGKPVRQIFNKIKADITSESPQQGKKLTIFPENECSFEVATISEPKVQNVEYVVRWNMLQSLRDDDSLGVKKQMYNLIKKFTNQQRMSYIFLEGDRNSGKTTLMSKTRIYTLNRKVFTHQLVLDLLTPNEQPIQTMLEMRLAIEPILTAWRAEVERRSKDQRQQRIASLIIFDHAQKIIQYQYGELTKYIEEQLKERDKLKYGKIVILTRKVVPLNKKDADKYDKASKLTKEPPDIQLKELNNFISRHFSELKEEALKLRKEKNITHINLVKGIKSARSLSDLETRISSISNSSITPSSLQPEFIEQQQVFQELNDLTRQTQSLLQDVNVEVAENHHMYLSTIFQEIANKSHDHAPINAEEWKERKRQKVRKLVKTFKTFFQRTFMHQPNDAIQSFKKVTRLSLKIAGLCYLTDSCFKNHIFNCQKLYVMASVLLLSPFLEVQIRVGRRESQAQQEIVTDIEGRQLEQLLKQYKWKVLLTFYTYYTECHSRLENSQNKQEQNKQGFDQCNKRALIILDELYHFIQKRNNQHEIQIKQIFLKEYQLLNKVIQEVHYNSQFRNLSHQNHRRERRGSNVFELSNDNVFIQESTDIIHIHHKKIQQYWRLCEQMKEANNRIQILSKDTMVLLLLSIIKLIIFNQLELEYLESRGENYIKREMQAYVELYVHIMQAIEQSQIFIKHNKSHSDYVIWQFPQNTTIKALFKKYFKMFVDVYFRVQKLRQNLTKNYSIKIFNQLLILCDTHPKIRMASLKKQIQTHKDQQFLSNYSCQTYIALPLLKFKNVDDNIGNRCNLKRYQSHIERFQQNFFDTLDREIKHEIFVLNQDIFITQRQSKSLIQLLIINCSDNAIECESLIGKGQILRTRYITSVPSAPVVILFGVNVKSLIDIFRQRQSSSVLILLDLSSDNNLNQRDFLQRVNGKETWPMKSQRIEKLQQYACKLEVSYSLLQFFYTSFCKHFFTVDHVSFLDQVRSSFHLAKAQAFIKTKIRLQTSIFDAYENYIKQTIQNIQLIVSQRKEAFDDIKSKPAYHFMFKQYKPEHIARALTMLIKKEKKEKEIQGEIGCNREICELLNKIHTTTHSLNFIIIYKSLEMLEQFTNTLIIKLKKYKKYDVQLDPVVPETFEFHRTSSYVGKKSKIFDKQGQQVSEEQNKKKVILFEDLGEAEFQSELKYMSPNESTTIRLFFNKFRYKSAHSNFIQDGIQENYNTQKLEFQLFFLECKSQKPNVPSKGIIAAFKKVIDIPSLSLHQIKTQIQNRNH